MRHGYFRPWYAEMPYILAPHHAKMVASLSLACRESHEVLVEALPQFLTVCCDRFGDVRRRLRYSPTTDLIVTEFVDKDPPIFYFSRPARNLPSAARRPLFPDFRRALSSFETILDV